MTAPWPFPLLPTTGDEDAPATSGAYYTPRALLDALPEPTTAAPRPADDLAQSAADALSRADVALRRGQACRVDATDAELREAANMMAEAMNRLRTERRRVVGILISRWTKGEPL